MTEPVYSTEPVDSLIPFPGNARRGDIPQIVQSLHALGQYKPVVVQLSTRHVMVGNHTRAAYLDLRDSHKNGCPYEEKCGRDWAEIDVRWVDCDNKTAKKINLVDNRSADLGDYDNQALAELLRSMEGDYAATGYDDDFLVGLLDQMASDALDRDGDGDGEGEWDESEQPDVGTLLALADISVAEPTRQPANGTIWKLGDHLLVIARISDEHYLWRDYLEGRTFAPYPDPYLTASEVAREKTLLMVQPNRYLAGHLLDKHEAVFPGTVEQVK